MQETGQFLPSFGGEQPGLHACRPSPKLLGSHNFPMAFIPPQPEYGRDAMGGPLSYPAHISAVSALIKDTGQIGSWLDWEAHAIPRFRRFRDEIVHTDRPPTLRMGRITQRICNHQRLTSLLSMISSAIMSPLSS